MFALGGGRFGSASMSFNNGNGFSSLRRSIADRYARRLLRRLPVGDRSSWSDRMGGSSLVGFLVSVGADSKDGASALIVEEREVGRDARCHVRVHETDSRCGHPGETYVSAAPRRLWLHQWRVACLEGAKSNSQSRQLVVKQGS